MKWRWNIAWRMGTGFGVFILAVAILLVVTRMNLSESSALGQEIDEVLVPSLGALEQLDQTLADSRVCINHWLTRQNRAEDEEKVLLRAIVDRKLPDQMATLKAMDGAWTPAAAAHVDTLRQEVDRLRVLYGYIMELLPNFRSYDNPAKVMEAELPELGSIMSYYGRNNTTSSQAMASFVHSTMRAFQKGGDQA